MYIYMYIYVYIYICMYTYVCIYMYVYIFVCICICSPFCLKQSVQLLLLVLWCKNSKVLYCQIMMSLVEWPAEKVAEVQAMIRQA